MSYSNHCTTTAHEASGTDQQSYKFAESKLSTSGNKDEHLYEPSACESFTEWSSFSTLNEDDAHFNFSGDVVDPYEQFDHL